MQVGSYRYNCAERQTFLVGSQQEKLSPGKEVHSLGYTDDGICFSVALRARPDAMSVGLRCGRTIPSRT